MKKVILAVSFIMLVLRIFVYIKCFNGESKEDLLAKYHITNISDDNYTIDVIEKRAPIPSENDLVKYYQIDLDVLDNVLKIIN